MVQVEQLASAKTEKLYRDDLIGIGNVDPGYIRADQIKFDINGTVIDSSSVNGSPVLPSQSGNFKDIIKFLKEEHYNYIKSLQRYYATVNSFDASATDRTPCSNQDPLSPPPPPPPPDDSSGTNGTGSSAGTGNSSSTNQSTGSATDYSDEDYVNMMEDWGDTVDETIDSFAEEDFTTEAGGYTSADAAAIEAYQESIQKYLNLMRLLAMLLTSRLELVSIASEQMTGIRMESSSSCLKIVNGFCSNRAQMVSAQLAQLFEYITEHNEAYYDKQKKKIEEEYSHWYSSQKKKEQALADATARYERALRKTVESMASAFATAGNVDFDSLSAEEAAKQMESITASLYAAAANEGYTTTNNGYYDIDADALEEYRSTLTRMQNLTRDYLIIYDAKNEVTRVVSQILTGNQGAKSKKEAVIGAYEDKFAAGVTTLESIFSAQLKLMEVHNTKVYHQKQVEKHEKATVFKVFEWINKGLSIVVGVLAVIVNIAPILGQIGSLALSLIAAGLWVAGEGCDLAGQYYADSQVDDELDISQATRDEEDTDTPEVYEGSIPTTASEQAAIDDLDEIGYVQKEDGLLYMDSTQVAEALGELSATQNRIRILLSAVQARFDVASIVYQSVYGISLNNNYNLVQSVYEAKNQQYLFMFQLRSYLKEQKRYYQNLELAQAKSLEKAAWTFGISAVCSIFGAILGGITSLGFLSGLCGGLGDVLASYILNDWYKDYENLEAQGNVTSISTEENSNDSAEVSIDKQEQQILEDALEIGMMATGTNGFGMSYVMVDPADIAVIRQRLAAIQTLRMCLVLARRAMAQINNIVNAELTGIVPNGRAYELSMQVSWAQNQVINQQLQQIISFKSQQVQLQNSAADAHRQYWQGIITGGISAGINAIGGGWGYSSGKWGGAAEKTVDSIYTATDIVSQLSSTGAEFAFNWSDATRDSSLLNGLDPQKILIDGLDEYYATTRGEKEGGGQKTVSKEELEILTQITSELIESMKSGQWGINSGLQIYFSNLMEKVYRIQECVAKANQTTSEIAGIAHQQLTGKPSFSSVDAQLLLSPHQSKAMGFVSDMFGCLEQITVQHNRMSESRKQMWLSVLDMAVTLVEVAISVVANSTNNKLKENEKAMNASQMNMKSMDTELQSATTKEQALKIIKTQAPSRIETNTKIQKTNKEMASLYKELAFDQALRALISLLYPWIRIAVDKAIISPLMEKNNQKDGVAVALDTATDDELTNMHRETIALSLQSGEALLASTEAATNYADSTAMFDTFWSTAQNCINSMQKYTAIKKAINDLGKAQVSRKSQTEFDAYSKEAADKFAKIVDEISALKDLLAAANGDPQKIKPIVTRLETLNTQMETLKDQVAQASALVPALSDPTQLDQDLPVPPPYCLQMQIQKAFSQFSQQVASSTSALNAYLSVLEQQAAQTEAPATAGATASLDDLAKTASQLSDSEVVSAGLTQDVPETEAMRQSTVSAEGKPLSELSEKELLALLADRRGLRDALLQSNRPEACRKLEVQISGLEKAIQEASSGNNIPEGVAPADYIKMLEAEKSKLNTQLKNAADPKKSTDWAAVKATAAEINLIFSELRNKVRTRLLGTSSKGSGNRIKPRMSETDKSACVERELNNLLEPYLGTSEEPASTTSHKDTPKDVPEAAKTPTKTNPADPNPEQIPLAEYHRQETQAKTAVAATASAALDLSKLQFLPETNYYRQRAEAELAEKSLSSRTTTASIS